MKVRAFDRVMLVLLLMVVMLWIASYFRGMRITFQWDGAPTLIEHFRGELSICKSWLITPRWEATLFTAPATTNRLMRSTELEFAANSQVLPGFIVYQLQARAQGSAAPHPPQHPLATGLVISHAYPTALIVICWSLTGLWRCWRGPRCTASPLAATTEPTASAS